MHFSIILYLYINNDVWDQMETNNVTQNPLNDPCISAVQQNLPILSSIQLLLHNKVHSTTEDATFKRRILNVH